MLGYVALCCPMLHYVGVGGKRRAGVPRYGVPGCGKHGVLLKTRRLSAKNNKVAILSFQIAMKINWRETSFFRHKSELNIS